MDSQEFMMLLKDLQVEHLSPEIRKIVRDELERERTAFWVPAERHWKEHEHLANNCIPTMDERDENHRFISIFRRKGNKAGEIAFYLCITAICVWAGSTFLDGFFSALRKAFTSQ